MKASTFEVKVTVSVFHNDEVELTTLTKYIGHKIGIVTNDDRPMGVGGMGISDSKEVFHVQTMDVGY